MAPGNVQGTFAESIVSMRPVIFNKSKYFGKNKKLLAEEAGNLNQLVPDSRNSSQPRPVSKKTLFRNRLLVEIYGFKRPGSLEKMLGGAPTVMGKSKFETAITIFDYVHFP